MEKLHQYQLKQLEERGIPLKGWDMDRGSKALFLDLTSPSFSKDRLAGVYLMIKG